MLGRMGRARHFPEGLTRHSYWLAVLLPLLLPLAWSLRDVPGMGAWFAWLPLVVLYVVIPVLDLVIGRDLHNPAAARGSFYPDTLIPVLAGVSFLLVLAWSLSISGMVLSEHGFLALVGWVLSLGDIGGAIGINVAHELIHRRSRPLSLLGGLMLASVWYPGFKLEHPRWHHVHVSTPEDPSSAPAGSTVYGRVPRAVWLNTVKAFELGAAAARARGWPLAWLVNEVTAWYALSALLTLAAGLVWGALAALVLFLQGVLAAALLEIINYVEHYGLERERRADGRYVPPNVTHSWDCDFWLSNAMLIQLPRHADHHTHPQREFSVLQKNEASPLLPLGYPLLVLIAMVPPLWRRLIHPRLPAPHAGAGGGGG
jgi:alkane 1-monooxygenase